MSEAIFLAEYASIPAGIDMLDQMVKRSSVFIIHAKPICIGKYLIVLGGEVGAVQEAQELTAEKDEARLLRQYLLTNAHTQILSYFKRALACKEDISGAAAIGILETRDAVSGFRSLDRVLKCGDVQLEQVWLGHFIGGKFCCLLTGDVEDIQVAFTVAEQEVEAKHIVDYRIIPAPDPAVMKHLMKG